MGLNFLQIRFGMDVQIRVDTVAQISDDLVFLPDGYRQPAADRAVIELQRITVLLLGKAPPC